MDLVHLTADQAAAFEVDNHPEEAVQAKYREIAKCFPDGPREILDVGGGAGTFADRLLAQYLGATVTNLDYSELLLAANKPNPRKRLVCASVGDAKSLLRDRKFDVITMNFFLHHLVGPTYASCRTNCLEVLRTCRDMLSESGVLLIAEHDFAGPFGVNVPSRVIYEITRIQAPSFVSLAKPYFNTAGTGVCFRSRRSWVSVLRKAGFEPTVIYQMAWALGSVSRRLKFAALGLTSPAQVHFSCVAARVP
jgi:ubiquinone/menaquinone biosynthesis C-methylase UbiE